MTYTCAITRAVLQVLHHSLISSVPGNFNADDNLNSNELSVFSG